MTNDKQQTAVEWYIEQHNILAKISDSLSHGEIVKRISDIEKQAKEMHEKETINFAQTWAAPSVNKEHLEYFYNETFKKQ